MTVWPPRERLKLFKGFYLEIRHKVVGKNNFSPLFVLYALKDRKIKQFREFCVIEKYFDDWKWTLEYKISTLIIVDFDGSEDNSLHCVFFYTLTSIHKEYEQGSKMKKLDRKKIYMILTLIFFALSEYIFSLQWLSMDFNSHYGF